MLQRLAPQSYPGSQPHQPHARPDAQTALGLGRCAELSRRQLTHAPDSGDAPAGQGNQLAGAAFKAWQGQQG